MHLSLETTALCMATCIKTEFMRFSFYVYNVINRDHLQPGTYSIPSLQGAVCKAINQQYRH